ALLATRSRAGACLLVLQAVALGLWCLRRQSARTLIVAVAVLAVAAVLILPAAGPRLLQGFELNLADGRAELLRRAVAAAATFVPLGSGPGTFASAFATFDTVATLDRVYVNQAHSEPVQLLFELGLAGIFVYLFCCIVVAKTLLRDAGDGTRWACALGLGAVLLQSLVDYPLRTPLPALAAAALAACVLAPRRSR
ncbi:MAG TPA: O-antigen ligase family protein, partial [Tahibacter sp.]|uniref:O-antigen ligase family protein n=1 Tax=Tahibacter sp. TaxID=2056211 RepID=UPI002CA7AADB